MHNVLPYAAVLALIFVALSVRTLRLRRRVRIAIGHGDNELLLRAMRVHANFAEYVPLALLLMYFVETTGAGPAQMHALGACLTIGRISHAFGVGQVKEDFRFRVLGMALTFTVLIACALRLLYVFARQTAA